jgi:DNA-binding MarR family transcriptional regulator
MSNDEQSRNTDGSVPLAVAAAELRAAVTLLSRRLRAENRFPSSAQAAVLGHLRDEGPQTTTQLAAVEHMRPQSMAQAIHDLEIAGLVARRRDLIDRRQVMVELTRSGREALEEDRRRREMWFKRAIADTFSPQEQELLVRAIPLLNRLSGVADGKSGPGGSRTSIKRD